MLMPENKYIKLFKQNTLLSHYISTPKSEINFNNYALCGTRWSVVCDGRDDSRNRIIAKLKEYE
jgi:hypothetical protein